MLRPLALCLALSSLLALPATTRAANAALVDSFDLAVPQAPTPVTQEGRQRLYYELHLTSFNEAELAVDELRVIDDASGAVIQRFAGKDLADRSRVIGRPGASLAALRPGERGVIYLELDVGTRAPRKLRHALGFRRLAAAAANSVEGARVEVGQPAPLLLGPPLRGGPWVAIHSPDWPRGHRRVFYTMDGRARLPGRHAIDWVKVDPSGKTIDGDPDLVASSLGYGAEVLAVADARVAAVRDDAVEAARVSANPKHDFDEAPGNYVVLALADGRHVAYEHLKPGSLKVRVGDSVRRGEVIGALGFTGDSTGPHLHFHVADGTVPLSSEGLPYGLSGFRVLGRYERLDRLGKEPWLPLADGVAAERKGEQPGSNTVIEFPR